MSSQTNRDQGESPVLSQSRMTLAALLAVQTLWLSCETFGGARPLAFPDTLDGQRIVAMDPHTHTVFSDGLVWPTIRVREAEREKLGAIATTDHWEWQPHGTDIPNTDRNRPYEIEAGTVTDDLVVINGIEITRGMPPGHINAIFLTDANQLQSLNAPVTSTSDELYELTAGDEKSVREALTIVREQGGFAFWNHPYGPNQTDAIPRLSGMHKSFIGAGLLHGIEVANGEKFHKEAIDFALDQNLVILGSSDIHGLMDWDVEADRSIHRTTTLVLLEDNLSADAIKQALFKRQTVALYRQNFIGRPREVTRVITAVLRLTIDHDPPGSRMARRLPDTTPIILSNNGPVALRLRAKGDIGFLNATNTLTIPAFSSLKLRVKGGPPSSFKALNVEMLNTFVSSSDHLSLPLTPTDE